MSMRSSTYVHHAFVGCCPPFRKLTCPRLDGSPCSFSNNSRISSWSALHQGFSTTVRLSGWRSQRPSLSTDSLIRFSTGAQASIGVCLVYDGDFGPAIERTTVSSRQLVWNLDSWMRILRERALGWYQNTTATDMTVKTTWTLKLNCVSGQTRRHISCKLRNCFKKSPSLCGIDPFYVIPGRVITDTNLNSALTLGTTVIKGLIGATARIWNPQTLGHGW